MHWKVFSKVVIAIIWLLFESVNMIPGEFTPVFFRGSIFV